MQNVSSPPVRIAVLDTGIDLNHPDIEARQEQIKGKYNWVNSRYKNKVPDNLGHGTHITNIVLDYVPNAEIYVAKIAGNEPPVPKIVADVRKCLLVEQSSMLTYIGNRSCRERLEG